jgi:hypothetical protein
VVWDDVPLVEMTSGITIISLSRHSGESRNPGLLPKKEAIVKAELSSRLPGEHDLGVVV